MVIHGSTHPSVSSKVPKQASSKQQASQRCCMPICSAAQLRGTVPVTEPRFVFYLFFTFTKPPPDHKKHQIISSSCIALLRMPYYKYYCSSNNTGTARTHAHSQPNLVSYSLPSPPLCIVQCVQYVLYLTHDHWCAQRAVSYKCQYHKQNHPTSSSTGKRLPYRYFILEEERRKKKKRTLNMV